MVYYRQLLWQDKMKTVDHNKTEEDYLAVHLRWKYTIQVYECPYISYNIQDHMTITCMDITYFDGIEGL